MKTQKVKEPKAKYKQSETVIINRSQIKFAAYNPKNHSVDDINEIKANIKRVALLGGIIYNETTCNLIDGHKRVMALDIINGYDGTKETDYKIKVEKIALDEKTEREQNIWQTKSRTELSNELLAVLLPEIDTKLAGLDDADINLIIAEVPNIEFGNVDLINSDVNDIEKSYDDRKQAMKDMKAKAKEKINNNLSDSPYFTVTFDDVFSKEEFLNMFNFASDSKYIKGEILRDRIEEIQN
jgi:hypothetical protein